MRHPFDNAGIRKFLEIIVEEHVSTPAFITEIHAKRVATAVAIIQSNRTFFFARRSGTQMAVMKHCRSPLCAVPLGLARAEGLPTAGNGLASFLRPH